MEAHLHGRLICMGGSFAWYRLLSGSVTCTPSPTCLHPGMCVSVTRSHRLLPEILVCLCVHQWPRLAVADLRGGFAATPFANCFISHGLIFTLI